jgi:uncharacterized protein (UPF0548 family)
MGLLRTADLRALADAPLTYPDVGATRSGPLPAGYDSAERSAVVGSGRAVFERAAAAVLDWGAQRGAGLRVRATGPAGVPGTVVVLTAGLPRLGYDIPCRVVWARTEGDERGFGYGTLPGHPVSGEESFAVGMRADGDVVVTIRVFSRPATPLARLAGPLGRAAQRVALELYLAAIRRAAQGPGHAAVGEGPAGS